MSNHIPGFVHISSAVQSANSNVEKFQKGLIKPVQTFSHKMNEKLLMLPGDQFVIGGRSGVGKSAFLNILIRSIFKLNPNHKFIGLYWNYEMRDWRQILRIYSSAVEKSVNELLKERYNQNQFDRLKQVGKELSGLPIWFRNVPVDYLKWSEMIESVQVKYPEHTIINLFDHTRLGKNSNEKSEERKITNFMQEGVALKNKIECINIFLSQLNRNIEQGNRNRAQMGSTPPVLSDLFGADSVAQFSDHVLILHRPELYNIQEYLSFTDVQNLIAGHVVKQRDGWVGIVPFRHDLRVNKIQDWE